MSYIEYISKYGWSLLVLAIVMEVLWFLAMKQSDGLSSWPWNLLSVVFAAISIPSLALALKTIPASVAYSIWTGTSAVLIALIAIIWMGESFSYIKGFGIAFAVFGISMINFS